MYIVKTLSIFKLVLFSNAKTWQSNRENTPMKLCCFICQFAAVIVNHFLGDTQAESAMGSVCSILICPIESVKDAGLVLRGDTWAVILNSYYDIPGLKGGFDGNMAPGGRIADGIINQYVQRLLQHGFIALDQRDRFCGKAG